MSPEESQILREAAKEILTSVYSRFVEAEPANYSKEVREELAMRSIEKALVYTVSGQNRLSSEGVGAVILLTTDGNMIYAGRQAQYLLVNREAGVKGVTFDAFVISEYQGVFKEMLRNAYEAGGLYKSNLMLHTESKALLPATIKVSYCAECACFFLQLKENNASASLLDDKLQQKAFRMFVENVKDLIWSYNVIEQKVEYASPSVVDLTGYTQQEFLNMSVYDFYTPAYAEKTEKGLKRQEYIKGMFSERVREKEAIRKDGRKIWIEEHFSAMQDADGTFTGRLIGISRDITRRKIAETKLKESQQRYKMLFYDNYSSVLLIEPETLRIEDANNSACTFYGYSYEALTRMHVTDLTAVGEKANKRFFRSIRETGRKHFTAKQVLADQTIRHTEVYSGIIYLETRTLIYAIVHDITDRVTAGNKLKEERRQFLSLLNSINQIIYVADRDYNILFANKTFKARFGEDVLHKKCYHVMQDKDRPCGFCTNPIIFNQKEAYNWEQYNEKTGAYFFVIDKAIKWHNNVDARFTLAIDITRMKKAEAENRKLSAAVEQSPASIVMTDTKGTIEYVNPTFVKNTGYAYEEALGQNPRILKSGKTPQETYDRLWETITSGKVWKGVFVNRRKNGEEYYENAIITPIFNDNRRITHYLSIKNDVTKEKMQEEALKKSEAELREANAAKDKFFSIIAHDLKNPFNTLLGFTELLFEKHKTMNEDSLEHYLQTIYDAAHRNYDLLRNLLLWSRSQSGRMEFNPGVSLLKDMVEPNKQLFKDTAEQKKVQIDLHIPENLYVKVDDNMIRTTVRNLMSNALKYTPQGGTVTVGAEQKGDMVQVAVSDTGVGIAQTDIPKLFRIDESYSTQGTQNEKGTGLGLILCREFVEQNGGKIWVESEQNRGSTFYFTLPAATVQKDDSCGAYIQNLQNRLQQDRDLRLYMQKHLGDVTLQVAEGFSSHGVAKMLQAMEVIQEQRYTDELDALYKQIKQLRDAYQLQKLQQCLQNVKEIFQDEA